jgi:PTS system fructose-specific IIC component/PTS system nitrogen regulatory IIA component
MCLCDVFSPDLIKIALESEEKEEVFEELVDLLCQALDSTVREEVLRAVKIREAQMSTGIQKGIAIPHGKTNAIEQTCGVLGISQRGVDYDALDGEPVHLIFMIVAPQSDSEKHLQVLRQLAQLLNNPQFYQDVMAQKDAQSVYQTIKGYEDSLFNQD